MTLPLIAGLKEKFPSAEIHFFINALFAGLLPDSPSFKLVALPFNQMVQTFGTCQSMEQALAVLDDQLGPYLEIDYKLVLNCSGEPTASVLTSLLQGEEKQGMMLSKDDCFVQSDSNLSLFTKHDTGRVFNWSHQVEIFLSAVKGVIPAPLHRFGDTLFGSGLRKFVGDRKIRKPYLLIFPGASIPQKKIDRRLLDEIVKVVLEKTDCLIVFSGRIDDHAIEGFPGVESRRIEDWSGRTDFRDLFNLIAYAECVISNDSGPMHIAALLNKKNIVVSTGAAYFPETSGYNDDVLVFVPGDACYPCPWIGYPCSNDWRCSRQFDSQWISGWVLHYLGKSNPPPFSSLGNAYRTRIDETGLRFIPYGVNVLGDKEWLGLMYQSFWKECLFGWNAEKIFRRLLRYYGAQSEALSAAMIVFEGELEKINTFVDVLIYDFQSFYLSGENALITRINQKIEQLFEWSQHEGPMAPLLHHHNVRFHSVVSEDISTIVKFYFENTLRLKGNIGSLKRLLSVLSGQVVEMNVLHHCAQKMF